MNEIPTSAHLAQQPASFLPRAPPSWPLSAWIRSSQNRCSISACIINPHSFPGYIWMTQGLRLCGRNLVAEQRTLIASLPPRRKNLKFMVGQSRRLEKTQMLRKTEGRRRRGRQRMRWLDGITNSVNMSLSSRSWWWTGSPRTQQSMRSQAVGHDWTDLNQEDALASIHLRFRSGESSMNICYTEGSKSWPKQLTTTTTKKPHAYFFLASKQKVKYRWIISAN